MYIYNCLKDFFGKKLIENCIDNPILIIGMGRSGTSVLLQALGKHPEIIAFPGEAPFLTSIGGNASLFISELNNTNSEYYRSSLKTDIDYFHIALARLGVETAGGKHYALKEYVKALWREKSFKQKKHWSAKTFPTEIVAKGLLSVYPNAKFIYIVRNGVDVVHSMTKFHGFKNKEFESHCHNWNDSIKKYRYLTKNDNALFVRHEHLLSDPIVFFSTVFDFLNLSVDSMCIRFVTETLVHPLDQPTHHQLDAVKQLKDRESPFKSWPVTHQDTFLAICSESMKELGYTLPRT